jgi:hypothetical protein
VQPPRWPQALAEFSALHEGWLVSVDVIDPAIGAQPEVREIPLIGVAVEPHRAGGLITIAAASRDGEQITHTIHSPTRVWIERTDQGADVAMQIESAEGRKTILRLKTPAAPESVDGIVR